MLDDVHDATILQVTHAVVAQTVTLLEKNVLRAMDAIHVACVIQWKADLFITSDKRQLDATIHSELQCEYLGQTGKQKTIPIGCQNSLQPTRKPNYQ